MLRSVQLTYEMGKHNPTYRKKFPKFRERNLKSLESQHCFLKFRKNLRTWFPRVLNEYIAPELFLLLMTSLFAFYHCLLSPIIFCRFHVIGVPYIYFTSYLPTFCYLASYLTLPHILPYLTFCLTLPYLTFCLSLPYLTLPYVLPYLTLHLTLLTLHLTLF